MALPAVSAVSVNEISTSAEKISLFSKYSIVIPAFNEAGPHMGVGRIHNEDLIDISEYMGKKGRDYGEGIKRKNKKSVEKKPGFQFP